MKGRCEVSSSQDKTTIMNLNITEKANTKNTERPVKTLHWPKVEQEGDVFLPKEIKIGENIFDERLLSEENPELLKVHARKS